MKFGLRYCNIGPLSRREPALELARMAEEIGFESLWSIEHVVIPAGYTSAYPYSDDGRFGCVVSKQFAEANRISVVGSEMGIDKVEVFSSATFISLRGSYGELAVRRDWSQMADARRQVHRFDSIQHLFGG